jgi:CIC family chloride channel protein
METARGPRYPQRRLVKYLTRLAAQLRMSQRALVVGAAVIVGLGAGAGALLLRWLIATTTRVALQGGSGLLAFLGAFQVICIPALGGLLVGVMTSCLAREAKGHGVPEVIEAVALRGGRMRPVVPVVKLLASAICIGTGGSAGREGPVVQVGAGVGSTLGQWLGLSDEHIRQLVACGAAGGIAAAFNAPVAGVVFALEIILRAFNPTSFCTTVIASVAASEMARAISGNVPAFVVPPYALVSLWEFPLYAILGIAAAGVGIVFTAMLYACHDVFEGLTIPAYLKPAAGGLLIGTVGVAFPQIFGVGYDIITQALHNALSLRLMAVLVVAKMLATSLTLGSGGTGGILVPSLYLGAMLGGCFGTLVHALWPTVTAVPGTYALVGMAAVFAAVAHAPITALLILFEMTGDYRIVLPVMLTTVIGTFLAERMASESIYTLKLSRRGIHLSGRRTIDILQTVQVKEVMETRVDTVPTTMGLPALARRFERLPCQSFPVLDARGALWGMLSIEEFTHALAQDATDHLTAGDIATTSVATVYPDEPVSTAMRRMAIGDFRCLPVVERSNTRLLLGVVHWDDMNRASQRVMKRRSRTDSREGP